MRREQLALGDRVWVWAGSSIHELRGLWFRGTIVEEDKEDDVFYVEIDGTKDHMPPAQAHRYSPNVRPMGILDLIAEAASDHFAR